VDDAVEATRRSVEAPARKPVPLNVGTGIRVTVAEVAKHIVGYFASSSEVAVTGAFRDGDIRHNCASMERLGATLDFVPSRRFESGLPEFLA